MVLWLSRYGPSPKTQYDSDSISIIREMMREAFTWQAPDEEMNLDESHLVLACELTAPVIVMIKKMLLMCFLLWFFIDKWL